MKLYKCSRSRHSRGVILALFPPNPQEEQKERSHGQRETVWILTLFVEELTFPFIFGCFRHLSPLVFCK